MRRAIFALTATCVITILLLTLAQVTVVNANPVGLDGPFTPRIDVLSPQSFPTIYANPNVDISFEYNIEKYSTQIDSFFFSLDDKANSTLSFRTSDINMTMWRSSSNPYPPLIVEGTQYSVSKTLENLANGDHTIVVYANFSDGIVKTILGTQFTVDTAYADPSSCIISPLNQTTYNTTQVPLIYTTNKFLRTYHSFDVLWPYYSLDDSDMRYFEGNITLHSLSEGLHELSLVVIYNISRTNPKAEATTQTRHTIIFYTDTVAPKITNVSVDSTDTSNFLLNFSVDENASWVGYSLDNQANVTINGNAVLRDLPDGVHNVTVYAKDSAGNIGVSETISFTVGFSPPTVIVASIATATIVSGGLLVYLKKRKIR